MSAPVVVIGAGVSGLAVADDLVARGFDVSVIERQVSVGGNATSQAFDGFLMEHGPTTLNTALPQAMARIGDLGLQGTMVGLGAGVRKRYLRDASALHGISTHRLGFFLSGYLSLGARLSLMAEILRPRRTNPDEETIHAFVSRRFGGEFADKVMEPLAAGVFMGDAQKLSVAATFPRLVAMEQEYGSILRGVLAAKRGGEPMRHLCSWPGGIATLPQRLARRLGARIRTGVAVTGIARHANGFTVKTAADGRLSAAAVVLAVQPHVAAALLESLDVVGADALGAVAAPPIAVVYLGYGRAQVSHPLDGLGFLSTRSGQQLICGAQFSSTMFKARAPKGHVALSCYVGGARAPDLARLGETDLVNGVHGELSDLLGIAGAPVVARVRYWPRGLPQYTLGHAARAGLIGTVHQRVPGLFVTGNFLDGVSVANCLERARLTAEEVARQPALNANHVAPEFAAVSGCHDVYS
jgi:protoporphyrinogen/coproporphyrinogen III oxidase